MQRLTGGPDEAVFQLAFAPRGRAVVGRFYPSRALGVWDLDTGAFALRTNLGAALAVDHAGRRLAVSDGGLYRLYPWAGKQPPLHEQAVRSPRPAGSIQALAFPRGAATPDRWLAVAAAGVELWNPGTRKVVRAAGGHCLAVAVAPGGTAVAAIEAEGPHVVGWALPPGEPTFRFPVPGPALQLDYAPDGSALAVGSGSAVEFRDPAGRPRVRAELPGPATVTDLTFGPDGRWLAVATGTPTVVLLDPRTGAVVRGYDFDVEKVFAVAVAPDGLTAAAGGTTGRVVVWDVDG